MSLKPCKFSRHEGYHGYRAPGKEGVKCPGQVWRSGGHFPSYTPNPPTPTRSLPEDSGAVVPIGCFATGLLANRVAGTSASTWFAAQKAFFSVLLASPNRN